MGNIISLTPPSNEYTDIVKSPEVLNLIQKTILMNIFYVKHIENKIYDKIEEISISEYIDREKLEKISRSFKKDFPSIYNNKIVKPLSIFTLQQGVNIPKITNFYKISNKNFDFEGEQTLLSYNSTLVKDEFSNIKVYDEDTFRKDFQYVSENSQYIRKKKTMKAIHVKKELFNFLKNNPYFRKVKQNRLVFVNKNGDMTEFSEGDFFIFDDLNNEFQRVPKVLFPKLYEVVDYKDAKP